MDFDFCSFPKMNMCAVFSRAVKFMFFGVLIFIAPTFVSAQTFSDVSTSNVYASAIHYLAREGVVSGYPDGTFQPERPVNRAEALKILLLASRVELDATSAREFPDVMSDAWFVPFVRVATAREIVSGYPDGTFQPARTVNLVEAIKMLLLSYSIDLSAYGTNEQLYADTSIGAWYHSYLSYAKTFQLLDADSAGKVFPARPLTRGKFAEIVFRFLTREENACSTPHTEAQFITPDYFSGITLDAELPNIFFANEVRTLRGSTSGAAATVFYRDDVGVTKSFSTTVADARFEIPVEFTTPGTYHLSVLPGVRGQSLAREIHVLPHECAPADSIAEEIPAPTRLSVTLENNLPIVEWQNSAGNLTLLTLTQNGRRFERIISGGVERASLAPLDFSTWHEGEVTLSVASARSAHGYSYESRTPFSTPTTLTLPLVRHDFSTYDEASVRLDSLPLWHAGSSLTLSGVAQVELAPEFYIITPDGDVTTFDLAESDLRAGERFSLSLPFATRGTYILELNNPAGLAVLNHPVYASGTLPILPDFSDRRAMHTSASGFDLESERTKWLTLVNSARAEAGVAPVRLDAELTTFAQNYATQMATENFLSHTDPLGRDPDARRRAVGLPLPVGENLAQDVATEFAHAGLLRSASHRRNLLEPTWRRVGLGIARNARGEWLFAQEFSADPLTPAELATQKTALFAEINSLRAEANLPALRENATLAEATQVWSEWMAESSTLTFEIDGTSLTAKIRESGARGTFSTFIASSGGRITELATALVRDGEILSRDYAELGIGLAADDAGMLFATFVYR